MLSIYAVASVLCGVSGEPLTHTETGRVEGMNAEYVYNAFMQHTWIEGGSFSMLVTGLTEECKPVVSKGCKRTMVPFQIVEEIVEANSPNKVVYTNHHPGMMGIKQGSYFGSV